MENNNQPIYSALGFGALPQSVVPITKTQTQMQRTQYDPNKLKTLMDALGAPKAVPGMGETLANALAGMENPQAFTGGFGEQIIDPWSTGLTALARGFGTTYGARKAAERDAAETARENAIKAAQLDAEASKQAVTSQVASDYLKVNDPNAKAVAAAQEEAKNAQVLNNLSRELEDIGTRFDEDFKNIDEMQRDSTRWGRLHTNGWWGIGTTDAEKLARDQFNAWKGSMKNVLVNANRQAGSGTMSDADAERYEQNIGKAKTPAEARIILQSFQKRMSGMPDKSVVNGFTIETIE